MFKRFGFLAMTLAGALALFQPVVAQAHDWEDHRYHDRGRREWREHEWREHERRERYERRYYGDPYHRYDRCPR